MIDIAGYKKPKYGNIKTVIDGFTFDSKREATRYQELKLLEKAGEIRELELQPKYTLVPKTKKRRAVTYTADFRYLEHVEKSEVPKIPNHGCKCFCGMTSEQDKWYKQVVEDVKSPATAKNKAYIVKRNLFEYQNPEIEFREVM